MKELIITFLTERGEDAYRKVDEAGSHETGINKRIVKRVYKDKVLSEKPLIIWIGVKIPRLAVATELDKQIIRGLESYGAKIDIDFKIEIRY